MKRLVLVTSELLEQFVTHLLPITSILVRIGTIYGNKFQADKLENENFFLVLYCFSEMYVIFGVF